MVFSLGMNLLLAVTLCIAAGQDVTVMTNIGNITGQFEPITFNGTQYNLVTFYGIPYAEAPTGQRRFQKPEAKQPFISDFKADTMPPMCYQSKQGLAMFVLLDVNSVNISEDCLALNIFVPGRDINTATPRAVMVWIYGGGFQSGSQSFYDGRSLPALNDVILVTINYRLGVLGFLSTGRGSGNYGLWDQHLALKWVHDHIDKFGGNPNSVTIFGESAGSASVIYQAMYAGNLGLFHRVIAQSGSPASGWALDYKPRELYLQYAKANGCSRENDMDTVNCLREITAASLDFDSYFNTVVDGDFVKMRPFDVFLNKTAEAANILRSFGQYDILMGVNSAEGAPSLYEIDYLASTAGEDISNGYSMDLFKTTAIDVVLKYANVAGSPELKAAIAHEYIDWSDTTNGQKMLDSAVDLGSDAMMNAGVLHTLNAHSKQNGIGNQYFYVFDYVPGVSFEPTRKYKGATHGDEIMYTLGFPKGYMGLMVNGSVDDPGTVVEQKDLILSKHIMSYWANFAKYG